jgi:hypothetical protein
MEETMVQENAVVENSVQSAPSVFTEAEALNPEQAVNVLIQAAQFAQESGNLSLRDSVLLARSIDVLRPGTI